MTKLYVRLTALVAIALAAVAISPTIINSQPQEAVNSPRISQSETKPNAMVITVVAKKDNRAERLDRYFAANNSPFVGKGSNFVEIADKYDIDYTLLPAIAKLESQLGRALPAGSYNPYGWGGGRIRFSSFENANEVVANGLRTRYAPTGVITPARIGRTYAENPTWAARVSRYQFEISRFN